MKRILASFIMLISMALPLLLLSGSAAAVDIFPTCAANPDSAVCKDVKAQASSGSNPIIRLLKDAMEVISFITGIAAVILIIVSALRFITAGGDSGGVAKARGSLTYALIGVMVTALAQAIIVFVLDHV